MTRERQHLIQLSRESSQAKGVAILIVGAVSTLVLFFAIQNLVHVPPHISIILSLLITVTYVVYSMNKFNKNQKITEEVLNAIPETSVKQTFELYKKCSVGSFSLIFDGPLMISTSDNDRASLKNIKNVSVKKKFSKIYRTLTIEYRDEESKNFKVDRNPEVLEFVESQMKLYNRILKVDLS